MHLLCCDIMPQGTDKERYVFPGGFLSYPGLYCFRYMYIGCEMIGNKRQQTDTCQLLHVVSLWWRLVRFQSVKNAASRPKAENERFIDCPQGGEWMQVQIAAGRFSPASPVEPCRHSSLPLLVLGMVFSCWRDAALMHSWKPLPWLWMPTIGRRLLGGNCSARFCTCGIGFAVIGKT